MPALYFEDFPPDETFRFGGDRQVTKDEIIAFAQRYDPQPFHLDEAAGRASLLGGLAASGWHTCAMTMRAIYDGWLRDTASLGAPGIEEARWLRPVRPGDRLRFVRRTGAKRVSRSRPQMGLIGFEIDAFDQNDQHVFHQRHTQLVAVRHPQRAPAPPRETPAAPPDETLTADSGFPSGGYFEDIVLGAYTRAGETTFTRETIVAFAAQYDPQPFHLSDEAARASHFGALAASGWQTAAEWMGAIIRRRQAWVAEQTARGIATVEGGPSPGFVAMRWPRPVHAGDRIVYGATPIDKRRTSRKGWGLVTSHNTGFNQRGELAFAFRGMHFVPVRDA